jgi:hypothetical protein
LASNFQASNKKPLSFWWVIFVADDAGRIVGYACSVPNLFRQDSPEKDITDTYKQRLSAIFSRHLHNYYDKTEKLHDQDFNIVSVTVAELLQYADDKTVVKETTSSFFKYFLHLDAAARADFITKAVEHSRKRASAREAAAKQPERGARG